MGGYLIWPDRAVGIHQTNEVGNHWSRWLCIFPLTAAKVAAALNIESPACIRKAYFLHELIWMIGYHFQPALVLQYLNNSVSSCSVLAVCSGAQSEALQLMCTQTEAHTESGLSCYCVQGYGSLGLFGLVSRDFLALSDRYAEVIVVAMNSCRFPLILLCVCVCVCVCVSLCSRSRLTRYSLTVLLSFILLLQ